MNKYLLYISYTKAGKEILDDFTVTAKNRPSAKSKAMKRISMLGGYNRSIDEIHLMDEKFRRREASMASHEGKRL